MERACIVNSSKTCMNFLFNRMRKMLHTSFMYSGLQYELEFVNSNQAVQTMQPSRQRAKNKSSRNSVKICRCPSHASSLQILASTR